MNKRIEQLTFTRFISALLIFIGHFSSKTDYLSRIGANIWLNFGVAYFFILSGFVLTISYLDKVEKIDLKLFYNFMLSRLARVYPIYLLAMVLMMFIDALWQQRYYPLGEILLNVTLLQAWNPPKLINFPSWSLSCEFFFYACFLPLLLKVKRIKEGKEFVVIASIYLGILVGFVLLFDILKFDLGDRLNPLVHIPQFIIGMITAVIFIKNEKKVEISSETNISLLVIIILFVLFNKPLSGREPELLPAYVVFLLLIAHRSFPFAALFSKRIFVLLGNASYGLYIFQAAFVPILEHSFDRLWKHIQSPDLKVIILAVTSTLICMIMYIIVEKPLQRLIVNHLSISMDLNKS